ncbi:MAG: sulfatase [Planctomycetes bacterium]|nr:sulfatase [Planctomycetota bacterium]
METANTAASAAARSRRSLHRAVRAALFLAAACAAAGCTDKDESESPATVVRLLGQVDDLWSLTLYEQNFAVNDSLDDWHVLRLGDETVSPASEDAALAVEDGLLVVKEPGTAAVRFLEVPAGVDLELFVRLGCGGQYAAGAPCQRAAFFFVELLAEGEAANGPLERGTVRQAQGTARLDKVLALRTLKAVTQDLMCWSLAPDPDGIAAARMALPARDKRQLWCLVLPFVLEPARVASVRFARLPRVEERAPAGGEATRAAPEDAPRSGIFTLGGEVRPAVLLPPGAAVSFDVQAPANARTLAFGVAAAEGAEDGAESVWRAELDAGEGPRHLLSGRVAWKGGAPASFVEARAPWPLRAAAPASVRFSCEGTAPVLIAQPLLLGPSRAREPPNLLFISLDTLRADHLGAYGYGRPTSPFLDRFAANATLFTQYFSAAPYTLPAHATMLTGLFPPRHGALADRDRFDTRRVAYLPALLAENGFLTAGFTGSGFLSNSFGFHDGFDRFGMVDPIAPEDEEPELLSPEERAARGRNDLDAVAAWIEENRGQRWFVFLHTYVTHNYQAPQGDVAPFDTGPKRVWQGSVQGRLKHNSWIDDPPAPGDVEHLLNLYDATIHYCDRRLERFFARLEGSGLLEGAVVVLTSDHGEEFFEHGGLAHSVTLYDEMVRVPLIVRLPGQSEGRIVRDPVSMADLAPTLADLLGLPPLEDADGRSRKALLLGARDQQDATPIFAHVETEYSRREALRRGPLKIIRGDTSPFLKNPAPAEWELFDLKGDGREQVNLAPRNAPGLEEMQAGLTAVSSLIQAGAVEGREAQLSPELEAQLEQLGYLGGKRRTRRRAAAPGAGFGRKRSMGTASLLEWDGGSRGARSSSRVA